MSDRSLDSLHPVFKPRAEEFIDASKAVGLDVLIYCTFRTLDEQAWLYEEGRTRPGPIVTHAPPGQSAHNYGMAIDGAPLVHGRIAWNDHPHWVLYGQVAASVGLEWGGEWVTFKEMPHIQLPNWRSHVNP